MAEPGAAPVAAVLTADGAGIGADTANSRTTMRAWYIVSLSMVAYILSQLDRQIITMLIQPIRADLQISDTQFSLIHGLAFALFYGLMGIPIARLADSRSRPLIIACGIAVWSVATAACGLARDFWQLFIARMAVGTGEAALSPAVYSMVADTFPREKLGLALGVYSLGAFLGSGLALYIGGAVIEWTTAIGPQHLPVLGLVKPWQMTLFIVGVPGLLLALAFRLTVRDPERKGAAVAAYSVAAVAAYVNRHRRAFLSHYVGCSCLALGCFALLFWAPAYLFRNYGLSPKEAGTYLGVIVLLGNSAGVLSGGLLTDWFTHRGHVDAALRAAIAGSLGTMLPAALFSSMPGLWPSLAVLGVAMYFASYPLATSAAALQTMAPNCMRAQVTSLFYLMLNIIGITGGATSVALCTDYLFRDEQMVGYSMSLMSVAGSLTGCVLLACGLKHYRATAVPLLAAAPPAGGAS